MNKFTFSNKYGSYENCSFHVGYYSNGNLGIEIWSDTDGPITKVTINPDVPLLHDRIAIKNYSENEGMIEWLISQDLIEKDPIQTIVSAWVEIPVHKLTAQGIITLSLSQEDS